MVRQGLALLLVVALSLVAGCTPKKRTPPPGGGGEGPKPGTEVKPDHAAEAKALLEEGRKLDDEAKFDEAAKYEDALKKYQGALEASAGNDALLKESQDHLAGLADLIEALKKLAATKPEDRGGPLSEVADKHRQRGASQKADTALDDASKLVKANDPAGAVIHLTKARQLLEKGRTEDAKAELSAALECDPKCGAAHYDLSFLLRTSGGDAAAKAQALEHAKKAVESEPKNAGWLENLATCHRDVGDWDNALKALDEAFRASGATQNAERLKKKIDTWRKASGKTDAPPPDAPKGDAPKGDAPAAPAGDAPKGDAPKADAPAAPAPAPAGDAPKADAPKADAPAPAPAPAGDAPKADAPAPAPAPAGDAPKADAPAPAGDMPK